MASKDLEKVESIRSIQSITRYTTFTRFEQWLIVAMVSYAAWFSTLSSFIYFPAIKVLSETLSVSVDKINLTITSYMAVATIAPALAGDAADVLGRRPIYVIMLTLYLVANIAIALSKSYSALLGLRVLQALAISGAFSVAYGVVADVTTPAERGGFVSILSFAITIAPSLGPILGGCLTYAADWTWIFWFLSIAGGLCLLLLILFLPETSRNIVGNGSIRPPKYLQLPIPRLMQHWKEGASSGKRHTQTPNPLRTLRILVRKDNAVLILATGLIYAVYTCINTTLSIVFIDTYSLNQWQAGLIYLPFGLGGLISSRPTGMWIDWAYRKARAAKGLQADKLAGDNLDNFPIEKARLGIIWIPMIVTVLSVIASGWTLHYRLHIAIPLCFQFIAGTCIQMDFCICNTLLTDKNHRSPATAQASMNIVRCALSAITIAFLQDLIDAVGTGWTFTFMGGLCIIAIGLLAGDYQLGTRWRQQSLPSPHPAIVVEDE